MKDFAETALILLPKVEMVEARSEDYEHLLKKSVSNLHKKLIRDYNIRPKYFTTNEEALLIGVKDALWVDACTPEDAFFIKRNTDFLKNKPEGEQLEDLYEKARKKYPLKRGAAFEERCNLITQREKFISSMFIKKQKVIFTFELPSDSYYKVKSEELDGRIIYQVSPVNFVVTATFSGYPIDIASITNYNGATRPLHSWEVFNE